MPVIMLRDLENVEEWLKKLGLIIVKNSKNIEEEDLEKANHCLGELTKLVKGILY